MTGIRMSRIVALAALVVTLAGAFMLPDEAQAYRRYYHRGYYGGVWVAPHPYYYPPPAYYYPPSGYYYPPPPPPVFVAPPPPFGLNIVIPFRFH